MIHLTPAGLALSAGPVGNVAERHVGEVAHPAVRVGPALHTRVGALVAQGGFRNGTAVAPAAACLLEFRMKRAMHAQK